METKVCKVCGKEKPITEFITLKHKSSGYGNKCKKCHAKYMKEYRRSRVNSEKDKDPIYYYNNHNVLVKCLKCEKEFYSINKFNRICPECKAQANVIDNVFFFIEGKEYAQTIQRL